MSSNIVVRMATINDFDDIYAFVNQLEAMVFDKAQQARIFQANLKNPDCIYLIACCDGRGIGYLSCHIQQLLHHGGSVGEIQEMFVEAGSRSSGVGQLLLNAIKQIAIDRGILQLEVTANLNRPHAHRFYEQASFKHTHKKFVWQPENENLKNE